ncbi:putative phosphoglycerate mutase 1, histidine phosphatase superfamily [Helianthus anomalus]
MAAMASHQSIATRQSHGYIGKSALHRGCGIISMKLFRGGSFEPLKREGFCCSKTSCGSIQTSQAELNVSGEAALIMIRHVEEAIEAGKRISNIPIDMIYIYALIRAQMTAMLAMTQHRRKKVPIVMHDENEQAKDWSQIFSEEREKGSRRSEKE